MKYDYTLLKRTDVLKVGDQYRAPLEVDSRGYWTIVPPNVTGVPAGHWPALEFRRKKTMLDYVDNETKDTFEGMIDKL